MRTREAPRERRVEPVLIATKRSAFARRSCSNKIEAAPAAVAPLPHGNETIMVVEDDALVRNFVTAQLQSLGYRTVTSVFR